MKRPGNPLPEKPWFLVAVLSGLIAGALFISTYLGVSVNPISCKSDPRSHLPPTPMQLKALLHYATSKVVPQQSFEEFTVSLDVLRSLPNSTCNFLVFGLGHDSQLWASFNAAGKTIFLEEDPTWVKTVLAKAPDLRAITVKYRTRLDEADKLLNSYKSVPECLPEKAYVKGNEKCKLALTGLPDDIYDTEWDMIMIDAPRGYFDAAPGRMGAIFSAAVMARNRKGPGVTHVFLHDVNRRVEKIFAEEFLCKKNLVKGVGRLWHFEIPPAANVSHGNSNSFC